jgi:hypothetical protein
MAQMMGMMGGAGGIMGMGGKVANIFAGVATYKTAQEEAKTLEEIGALEGAERRRMGEKLRGAQRAAYAKGGVEISGTPLDVMAETAATEELDALRLEYGYKSAAWAKRLQGKQAMVSAIFQSSSSIGQTILGNYGERRGMAPISAGVHRFGGSVNIVGEGGMSGRGHQVF